MIFLFNYTAVAGTNTAPIFSEIAQWPGGLLQLFAQSRLPNSGIAATLDSGTVKLMWAPERLGFFENFGSVQITGALPQASTVTEVPAGFVRLSLTGSLGSALFAAGIVQSRVIG